MLTNYPMEFSNFKMNLCNNYHHNAPYNKILKRGLPKFHITHDCTNDIGFFFCVSLKHCSSKVGFAF